MMVSPTGITIVFGRQEAGSDELPPVAARIYGFAEGQDEPVSHELVVPAGERVEQKLAKGLYSVQLTLPSGRIIQRSVRIDDDSNETFHFSDQGSPNKGFSLQESVRRSDENILVGAATASRTQSIDDEPQARRRASMRRRAQRSDRAPASKSFRPDRGIDPDAPPHSATMTQGIGLTKPLGSEPPAPISWPSEEPVQRYGRTALWRIAQADRNPPTRATRRWARIALPDGGVELASLPLPWHDVETEEFLAAEVLVDPARRAGAATTVAVNETSLAGLLAFLDRGQATAAGPLLAELERGTIIQHTISLKFSNPLAACAAAYVGLAVYPPGQQEQWDGWLENCMANFRGVPDAAIVHARRLILRPTSAGDNARAALALQAAWDSGVPFFSTGVFLLRDMLVLLSADHPNLKGLGGERRVGSFGQLHQPVDMVRIDMA